MERRRCARALRRGSASRGRPPPSTPHRTAPLSIADIRSAGLVLTAERPQRSVAFRIRLGTRAAGSLGWTLLFWRRYLWATPRARRARPPTCPRSLTHCTQRPRHRAADRAARPDRRLHLRRPGEAGPLTIEGGHGGLAWHTRVTHEPVDVAAALALRIAELVQALMPAAGLDQPPPRPEPPPPGVTSPTPDGTDNGATRLELLNDEACVRACHPPLTSRGLREPAL